MKYLLICMLISFAVICSADTLIDDFQVNSNFPGHPPQKSPYAIANWETETIYLTWLSQHDDAHWDVAFNRFDYDLEPLGDATYLNIRTDDADCRHPRLVLSDNGFGAAWIEADTPNRLRFRSFDASGSPLCNPINIIDNGLNVTRDSLNIAALNDGYLLVWYDLRDSSKVWARKVGFDGTLIGFNFPIRPDSTDSILGLEAQNHPDGRVLVSWVVDGMYSRGRWLDADGEFMEDVFEMAEAFEPDQIVRSAMRFGHQENGVLLQYSQVLEFNGYGYSNWCYKTLLNDQGMQYGERVQNFEWKYDYDELSIHIHWISSFPAVVCVDGIEDVVVYNKVFSSAYIWRNEIHSSISGAYIFLNYITEPLYTLCELNDSNFLYSYSTDKVQLRNYDIATLTSNLPTKYAIEAEYLSPHGSSDLVVNPDGSFRVIYGHLAGGSQYIYTVPFDSMGNPTTFDSLVSKDENLNPLLAGSGGKIEATNSENSLVVWNSNSDAYITQYAGENWSGTIDIIDLQPVPTYNYCNFDVTANGYLMLIWKNRYLYNEWFYGRVLCQGFDNTYSPFSNSLTASDYWDEDAPTWEYDIGVRDDGRFLVCWQYGGNSGRSYLIVRSGVDYNTFIGDVSTLSMTNYGSGTSIPVVKESPGGYIVSWIYGPFNDPDAIDVQFRILDSDGNIITDVIVADEEEAVPVSNLDASMNPQSHDMAVSDSSGNFAVCWQDARFDEGDIFCRQFNPDGSFYGYEYRVNSDPVGPLQKEPAVAFGPNDQLYFTWTDFRDPDHNGDIYCKVIEWEDAIGVKPEKAPVPLTFALHPPYPNPFNPTTAISYELPSASAMSLVVYDIEGCAVVKLVEGEQMAGSHQVTFDGNGHASGIYFVRIKARDYTAIQKMVLLK